MIATCTRATGQSRRLAPRTRFPASFVLLLALAAGCSSHTHTYDPKLRKIDELLDAQLPKGTSRSRVGFFLTTRGYKVEGAPDVHTVIAIVRHIDTDTLQPSTARVTFHFDANDRLTSYDLQRAPDMPFQP
jgi:hypothetical protein